MASLINLFNAQTNKIKAIIVFAVTIAFAGIIFLLTLCQMSREADKAMRPYIKSQEFINRYLDSLKKPAYLPEKYFTVFKGQQKIMSMRKDHNLRLSKTFFKNYYGVVIVLMLYSCIGGLVIFLLVNKGWSGSSIILQALFLSIVMVVTFFGFFPSVFKQQTNFDENIKYYMSYSKAEINILDQLSRLENPMFPQKPLIDTATQKTIGFGADSSAFFRTVDSMISVNNKTINDLSNYILTIDAKEIKSMKDIYKVISNSSAGNIDSTER